VPALWPKRSCYFVERIENKQLTELYNGKAQCVPLDKIPALYKAWS
jgi:hypothetical protein